MCESRSIVDVILGWSIDDITNPYLLRDKVKCLPKEFSSVDHYLESFRYPLIEEARSDLATRLFAVSEAPYVGIIVRNCIDAAGKKCDRDNIFSFSLYLAEQRGWYEPRVGDVVLLSTFVPKDSEDLQKGMSLAVVNEIGNEDRRECKGKMGATDGNEIMGGGSSYIALYLLNITEISHVWNSLNVDSNDPNINFDMIKKAFCHGSMVSKSCTCTPLKIRKEITSKINESQIDAVYSAVFPFSCNHSVSIKCISGKTATGKSEVASRIALAALSLNLKVILCMPEKISVVDAVSRFFKIVDGEHCGFNLKDIAVYGENSENPLDIYGDHISRTSDLSFCLEKIRLIICSVASLSSMKRIGTWDALIIDDASRVKECDLIVPLQLKGLRHVILAGNEYDLPPTTSSKISEDVGFTRSLFERFTSLCPPKKLFDIQYRMHPEISYFPTKRVLKCQLLNGPNVMDRIPLKHQLLDKIYKPYSFLDVADGKEEMHDDGDDWKNVVEAAVVIKILQKLFHACVISRLVLSVGVISPYEAQVQIIEDMIPERFTSNSDFSLWVRTFDQTQSSEADVIIISTVRCNATGVGCLSARYHMSISLTRARHYLWVVGNGSNLVKSHSIWQDLVLDAVERGCTFHVGEDKDLARVVIDVKRELDELDDLLNQESVLFNDKMWKVYVI